MPLFLAVFAAPTLAAPPMDMAVAQALQKRYPTWAASAGKAAGVAFNLLIDKAGKPIRCKVEQEFGDARLANEFCPILMKQRYRPATLRDGEKAPGLARTFMAMFVGATNPFAGLKLAPNLVLQVNHLPGGVSSIDVNVVAAVDQTGAVVDCGPNNNENNVSLAKLVCANRALLEQGPQIDNQGNPIGYVTAVTVRLHAPEAKAATSPQ